MFDMSKVQGICVWHVLTIEIYRWCTTLGGYLLLFTFTFFFFELLECGTQNEEHKYDILYIYIDVEEAA